MYLQRAGPHNTTSRTAHGEAVLGHQSVQYREKNRGNGSRWREDKVLTISDYEPGDGQAKQPVALTTTYLATMHDSDAFGKPARLEAERRGIRQARQAVVLGVAQVQVPQL